MAQTLINFRIDEVTKKQMEQICNELGITMSTAFNMFAKKMCREKRIPFDVSIDPFYSENNIKAIYESIKQLDEGKVVTKTIEELDEFRCTTVEIPEDLNIQSEATDEPLDESSEWFLIKNTRKDNIYTLERLFQNKQLLTKDYFLKRKRVRTKYVDFVYLGSDITYVNLTEWDLKRLLKRYGEKKLELMIRVLDEWLSRPENSRYKNAVRHKSCRKYFEARNWVEEKVRQKLIKEKHRKE